MVVQNQSGVKTDGSPIFSFPYVVSFSHKISFLAFLGLLQKNTGLPPFEKHWPYQVSNLKFVWVIILIIKNKRQNIKRKCHVKCSLWLVLLVACCAVGFFVRTILSRCPVCFVYNIHYLNISSIYIKNYIILPNISFRSHHQQRIRGQSSPTGVSHVVNGIHKTEDICHVLQMKNHVRYRAVLDQRNQSVVSINIKMTNSFLYKGFSFFKVFQSDAPRQINDKHNIGFVGHANWSKW